MAGGFRLGVDFGTTNTVAVLATPSGALRQLLVDGAPVLPSAVCLTRDRRLLVGRDALHAARSAPEGFDPNPKRRINTRSVRLGGVDVAVVDMISAVLGRVVGEARRVAGGVIEGATLTYPAGWDRNRCAVLQAAANRAGLPQVTLVPEPVAAGWSFLHTPDVSVPVGSSVVVYDFGAGTFDASVVRRSPTGFEVLASDGLTDTGGINIDAAIVGYLGTVYGPQDAASWQRLVEPGTPADLRSSILLWDDVRAGKEMLSRQPATLVHVPVFETDAPLGREQFNELARSILVRTVEATRAVIAQARVAPESVAGLFLVGGSSRIPLAATLLHQQLGIPPTVVESPELAVAEGALRSLGAVAAARPHERVDLMRGGPYAGAPTGFQTGPAPAYAGQQTGAYQTGPAYAGQQTGAYQTGPTYSPGPTTGGPYSPGPMTGAPTSGGPAPGSPYSPGPGYQSGPQQPARPPAGQPSQPPTQPPTGPQPLWAQTGTMQPAPPASPRNQPSHRADPPARSEPPQGGRHSTPPADRTAPLWPSSGPPATLPPTGVPTGPPPLPGDEQRPAATRSPDRARETPAADEPIPDQVPFEPPPLPDASRPLPPVPADAEVDEDADFDFPEEDFPEAAAGVIWAGNVPTPPARPPAPPSQPAPPPQSSQTGQASRSPAGRPGLTPTSPPPPARPAQRREPTAPAGQQPPATHVGPTGGRATASPGRAEPTAPATGRATPPAAARATAMPPAAPPPVATPPQVQNPVSGAISQPAADPAAERDELRRALSSVRTRIDVVEHHLTKLADALSTMRRKYVHGTFRDVEPMEPRANRQFRTAKEMFTIAERHAGNGNWSLVRTAIADTRQALEEATAAVAEVTGRLATLEKLAEDPRGPVERAQFVVRDAQHLFHILSPGVPAVYGQRLEALANRAANAARAAAAPRPNYWDLHNEVTAIKEETQATIVAMRASRA